MTDFEKNLAKIMTKLENKIEKFVGKLDSVKGNLTVTKENLSQSVVLYNEIQETLKKAGYGEIVSNTLFDNKNMIKERSLAVGKFKEMGKFDKTILTNLVNVQYGEIMALEVDAARAVKATLMNQVIAGVSRKDAISMLKKQLDTKLRSYTETYVRTAKQQFTQQVEDEIAKSIDFGKEKNDIWEYAGADLQDNSHDECIWALTSKEHAPYFTNAEKEEFEAGGGFEHTEPRWNCQHNFFITDMTYEEYLSA